MNIRSITRPLPNHVDIDIKLTPNSSTDKIIGVIASADDKSRLAIKVRAVPEKGRANKAVTAFLAKQLSLPKSTFEIASGSTSRNKVIRITGNPQLIMERLAQLEFRLA